jgi:glycosyltransferase involved in cell wall biosynthesis
MWHLADTMTTVSIIIPSRLKNIAGTNRLFIERAIDSIRAQNADIEKQIIVGVDPGTDIAEIATRLSVQVTIADKPMLSSAVNAASQLIEGDYVALLEDDDRWGPAHLSVAIQLLGDFDFTAANQIAVDENDAVIGINDFPIPSTWVMRPTVWNTVGGFSEDFPVHQDNDWLGRLVRVGAKRAHIIETGAPEIIDGVAIGRPELPDVVRLGGPSLTLMRQSSRWPLVLRQHHSTSWMGRVRAGGPEWEISRQCLLRLVERYGYVPW